MSSSAYHHHDSQANKTWLLMLSFVGLVVGIGFIFSQILGNPLILYGAIIFSIVMNVVSYWFSDKIAIASSGAMPADEQEYRELHRLVENLSITAGIPKPRVFIIPDQVPNAFATGRNKNHAAVAVTQGLLRILDRTELEGVIAHELGHIRNQDILVSTMAVVLAGFISLLADFFMRSTLMGGLRGSDDNRGGGALVLVGFALALLAPLFGTLLRLAVSRSREYLADTSGALLTRYPEGLASALEKINAASAQMGPMKHAHSATAHLFIANPFGARIGKTMSSLFATHPPAEERVQRLRAMDM